MYAGTNVVQEHLLGSASLVEVLSRLGLIGAVFSLIQAAAIEGSGIFKASLSYSRIRISFFIVAPQPCPLEPLSLQVAHPAISVAIQQCFHPGFVFCDSHRCLSQPSSESLCTDRLVQQANWTDPSISASMAGFVLALFMYYSVEPFILRLGGSATLNLSLLAANFWDAAARVIFLGGFTGTGARDFFTAVLLVVLGEYFCRRRRWKILSENQNSGKLVGPNCFPESHVG